MALVTERLILRAPQLRDLGDLHVLYSDPQTMKYWSTAPHKTRAQTQTHLQEMIVAAQRQLTYFVIEMDGCAIGAAGMHKADEVGFLLRSDFWRKGIITEAMHAIIPYLFETTHCPRLTADADPKNAASVGLLTALGFEETHRAKNTFCIAGIWSDSVYFALQRPS